MRLIGKRKTVRDNDREVYWCVCGSVWDQVVLTVPRDDTRPDWDDVVIEVGVRPSLFRDRVRHAWGCLRGHYVGYAEVILPYAEAVALRDGIEQNLRVIEANTTPVEAEDRN